MGKNKKLIIRDKMQTLQRVKSQIELVDKILQHNHIVLMCETLEGIKEFVIDINATELDLSHQKITIVPNEIGQLKKLTLLNLGWNDIVELPYTITQLTNMEILVLEGNYSTINTTKLNIVDVIDKFKNLSKLKDLNLGFNYLTHLPSEIGFLKNLITLNLSHNVLDYLPSEIGELKNLTTLNLSYNSIKTLPSQIGNIKNLLNLHIIDNLLSSLPIEIGKLTNLTYLDVSRNMLDNLPKEIGQLKKLMTLFLHENSLTILNSEIGRLTNLSTLNLMYNRIDQIPSEIRGLTNLNNLDLNYNLLTDSEKEKILKLLPNCEIYFANYGDNEF